mmetsp:Transcript_5093/g.7765  ORF Transcript_5093/g.7765 Transcript_5093/m.7765 type:complete len:217 (+) Transcript_5093:222-872(+)
MVSHKTRKLLVEKTASYHMDRLEHLLFLFKAVEVVRQRCQGVSFFHSCFRKCRKGKRKIIFVFFQNVTKFLSVPKSSIHSHSNAWTSCMRSVSHDHNIRLARMVIIAVYHSSLVPSLTNPLFRKIIVVYELKCFELLFHVLCNNSIVVTLQLFVDLIHEVTRKAARNINLAASFRQSNSLEAREKIWKETHSFRGNRFGAINVHSLEVVENISNTA